MKQIKKEELLCALENKVEGQLRTMIGVIQNLPEQVLLQPSTTGGWSIAQCIEHLNTYGNYYLPLMRKGMNEQPNGPVSNQFKSTWLGSYFTRLMEPGKEMKKMKAFKKHIPAKELDAYAVIATFIQQEELLLELLKTARQKDLNTIRIPISISTLVKMRLGDVFQFVIVHIDRHLQQAMRNIQQDASF